CRLLASERAVHVSPAGSRCNSQFGRKEPKYQPMPEDVPPGLTPFVFSDPLGKRWPRLRLFLLIIGILVFFGTVLFVQTLFVAPQMTVPFSLRQLKGQLKSLQKQNPAGPQPAA